MTLDRRRLLALAGGALSSGVPAAAAARISGWGSKPTRFQIGCMTYVYRDFPLLQAVIILKSILILSINLGVDILYAYVDPRIRLA